MSLDGDFSNYTAAQCFEFENDETQVACSAQHLNITDPPSIYGYDHYEQLWLSTACLLWNVTTGHRITVHNDFVWCTVPLSAEDAFLFVGLALLVMATLFGKLSAVWVLIAGGVVGVVNWKVNLGEISNAIAIWLNIQPPDLFFYAFLPPLLVDSAIRIDFFMFRKLSIHAVMMAFVMVVLSALILTPLILFLLDFQSRGWSWVHGALFASMIAPTDALAAAAILKTGGGPERLVVLMEGEALLNDASAITLFEVFMHIIDHHINPFDPYPNVWSILPTIITQTLKLAGIGFGIGLAMSWATFHFLRWLRWRGAKPYVEMSVMIAVAYLSFYVANKPAHGSGVISVVVFGLYGNWTSKWGMLSSSEESGAFDSVWDTVTFSANGLVFFWSGIAAVNYTVNSVQILSNTAWSYAAIPLIWVFMMLIRGGCLIAFNPIFKWIGEPLSWADIAFTTWCGLRGAVSLIMVAGFISNSQFHLGDRNNPEDPYTQLNMVNAEMSLWTSAFVLLTLVFNAPFIGQVMNILRLNKIPWEKRKMRWKARGALIRFTHNAVDALKGDTDEFLQGANWEAVHSYVDMSGDLKQFELPSDKTERNLEPYGLRRVMRSLKSAVLGPFTERKQQVLGEPLGLQDVIAHEQRPVHEFSTVVVDHQKPTTTSEGGYASDTESGVSFSSDSSLSFADEVEGEIPFLRRASSTRATMGTTTPMAGGVQPDLEMGLGSGEPTSDVGLASLARSEVAAGQQPSTNNQERGRSPFEERQITGGGDDKVGEEEERYYSTLPALGAAQLRRAFEEELQKTQNVEDAMKKGGGNPTENESVASHVLGSQEEHEAYYSSMPAQLGAALGRELRDELARQSIGKTDDRDGGVPSTSAAPPATSVHGTEEEQAGSPMMSHADYYSSMPAHLGTALGRELRAELGRQQPSAGSSSTPQDDPASVARATVQRALRSAFSSTKSPSPDDEEPAEEEEEEEEQEPLPDYYSSVPAQLGTALGRELRAELGRQGTSSAGPQQQEETPEEVAQATVHRALESVLSSATEREEDHPVDYYSSVPANVGRQLARDLAVARQGSTLPPLPESTGTPASTSHADNKNNNGGNHQEEQEASTGAVTALTGKKMQAELAKLLAAQRQASSSTEAAPKQEERDGSGSAKQAGASIVKEEKAPSEGPPGSRLASAFAAPTVQGRALSGSSSSDAAGGAQRSLSSMPAMASGTSLQSQLTTELARQRQASESAQTVARPPQKAPEAKEETNWDAYATVSGVTGRILRQELLRSRQLDSSLTGQSSSRRALLRTSPEEAAEKGHHEIIPFAASHHHPLSRTSAAVRGRTPFSSVLARHRLSSSRTAFDPVPEAEAVEPEDIAIPTSPTLSGSRSRPGSRQSAGALVSSPRAGSPMPSMRTSNVVESVVARSWQTKVDKASLHKLPLRTQTLPLAAMLGTRTSLGEGSMAALKGARSSATLKPTASATSLSTTTDAQQSIGLGYEDLAAAAAAGDSSTVSTYGPDEVLTEEAQQEMRGRLVSGLKRYFHGKRLQGLLSIKGLRILDYACDHAAEHTDRPFQVWRSLQKEIKGDLISRLLARLVMWSARLFRALPTWIQPVFRWPVRQFTGMLRSTLGRRMLVACEVAVEFYLSLLWSPQVAWLKEVNGGETLLAEVETEVDAAYQFIIDREIEAPDRFGAIQSYRAAMAVLRQQADFVEELFDSGMVDSSERRVMAEAVDKKARHLEITGPIWRPPRHRALMKSLPFMTGLSEEYFTSIFRAGSIREYRTGQAFWSSTDLVARSRRREGPGSFVVLSGAVKQVHIAPDGSKTEYFQGIGGVVGLVLMLTGSHLPGRQVAVAEGNVLGKGPVLFHLPQHTARTLRSQAAAGNKDAQLLEGSLCRLAGVYAIQGMEHEVRADVIQHLLRLATMRLSKTYGSGRHHAGHKTNKEPSVATRSISPPRTAPVDALERPSVANALPLGTVTQPVDRCLAAIMQNLAAAELRELEHGGEIGEAKVDFDEHGRALRRVSASRLEKEGERPGSIARKSNIAGGIVEAIGSGAAKLAALTHLGTGGGTSEHALPEHGTATNGNGSADSSSGEPVPSGTTPSLADTSEVSQHRPLLGPGPRASEGAGFYASAANGDGDNTAHDYQPPTVTFDDTVEDEEDRRRTHRHHHHHRSREAELRAKVRQVLHKAGLYTTDILDAMRKAMPGSVVLYLPPKRELVQNSHMVLIGGSLIHVRPPRYHHQKHGDSDAVPKKSTHHPATMRSSPDSDSGAPFSNTGERWAEVQAPRPLPWLADRQLKCNRDVDPTNLLAQRWQGGPQGALIVAALTNEKERPIAAQHYDLYGAGAQAAVAASLEANFLGESATNDWGDSTPAEESANLSSPVRQTGDADASSSSARRVPLLRRLRRRESHNVDERASSI